MELNYIEDKNIIVVKISEELDHHTCSSIREKIDDFMEKHKVARNRLHKKDSNIHHFIGIRIQKTKAE